jgi:hypothetical protein
VRSSCRFAALAFLALTTAALALAEDLTIVSKVTRDSGAPETVTSYLSSGRARMAQGGGHEILADYQSGEMTSIDNDKKTYSVTTQNDLDAWAAKLKAQMESPEMKKAQEAMKNLPPEQRKMMADFGSGLVNVEKAGTSRTIAGYACENWTITMGQFSRSEECLTTTLQFPAQPFALYKRYAESLRSLMSAMSPMGLDYEKMMSEQFKKLKGYPLAVSTTVDVMGHRSVTESEVVEIKRTPIPASAWQIPAGYTKVESPMRKALEGGRKRPS